MPEKQTNKERLKEITDSIEQGIKDLFESEKYKQYLTTMSKFHTYSVNNTMLIHMQRPNASKVAGFNKWRDQFERHVKKGEKGIKIIAPTPFKKRIEEAKLDPDTKMPLLDKDGNAIMEEKEISIPMFKVVTVFDVAQTYGKPLPELASTLTGDVQNYDLFMEALRRSSPVPLEIQSIDASMDGYFSYTQQAIAIQAGMSEIQTVCAAVHEIAHAMLHNYAQTDNEQTKKDRETEEVEAESIAYSVCQYYGIETKENSFGYLANWSSGKDVPELKASLETINKTASQLITDIDRHYADLIKEYPMEIAPPENASKEPLQNEQEALYLINDNAFLHIQHVEDGWDYSLYDKETRRLLDGGRIEPELIELSPVKVPIAAARTAAMAILGIKPETVVYTDPDVLEELLAAQLEPLPILPDKTADDKPDMRLNLEDMYFWGYTKDDMLPLSKDRALELLDLDAPVYMLYSSNEESLVFDSEDISLHDGLFGIATEDWTAIKEKVPVSDPERRFHDCPTDTFLIYQLSKNVSSDLRFASLDKLKEPPCRTDYIPIYTGELERDDDQIVTLENLYRRFNIDRPADFTGHSLSVSDIVAIKQGDAVSYHYCDSIGFKELTTFSKERPQKQERKSVLEQLKSKPASPHPTAHKKEKYEKEISR